MASTRMKLSISPASGLVNLVVDGRRVERPQLDSDGVFLGVNEPETTERENLSIIVHRLVTDAVPTRLTTRLTIDVSGGVREAVVGPVLPDEFIPVSLSSALPALFETDGQLRLQVRPG